MGSPTRLRVGERTNGDTRSRRTYRIRLPSSADEDEKRVIRMSEIYTRQGMRVVLNGAHQSFGLPEGEMPSGFVCYLSS